MRFYQELMILPVADVSVNHIWEKIFPILHRALVAQNPGGRVFSVGISFPDYDLATYTIGSRLRVFADTAEAIETLDLTSLLSSYRDYVSIASILPVPSHVSTYARFRRVHSGGSIENRARRRAKRKGCTYEEALSHFAGYDQSKITFPFIRMRSASTNNSMILHIEMTLYDDPINGVFGSYGLSSIATVPIF